MKDQSWSPFSQTDKTSRLIQKHVVVSNGNAGEKIHIKPRPLFIFVPLHGGCSLLPGSFLTWINLPHQAVSENKARCSTVIYLHMDN